MTNPSTPTPLEINIAAFLRALEGKNRSPETIRAYRTDLTQFATWLRTDNPLLVDAGDVTTEDALEFLAYLSRQGLSGVSRRRKLAAIRELYRYLRQIKAVADSPVADIDTPKGEERGRNWLTSTEYTKLLAAAGGNPRDFAILQVFLQTGIRISELCALTLEDIDLAHHLLLVRAGKGMKARTIPLEKKAAAALKGWLKARPADYHDHVFTNYEGEPLRQNGVRKLLDKYCRVAGITKRVTPHSLRHTFATHKAAHPQVTTFLLQDLLGHSNPATTRRYVHEAKVNVQKVQEATAL